MKPLNSGHLRSLKNVSVIERCPLLGGNLKKISTFATKGFVGYSWHVRYLGCPLLGGFFVTTKKVPKNVQKNFLTNDYFEHFQSFLTTAWSVSHK